MTSGSLTCPNQVAVMAVGSIVYRTARGGRSEVPSSCTVTVPSERRQHVVLAAEDRTAGVDDRVVHDGEALAGVRRPAQLPEDVPPDREHVVGIRPGRSLGEGDLGG